MKISFFLKKIIDTYQTAILQELAHHVGMKKLEETSVKIVQNSFNLQTLLIPLLQYQGLSHWKLEKQNIYI